MVRMKVKCTQRTEQEATHWSSETKAYTPIRTFGYNFAFVSGAESPENEAFWSATPSGRFELQTVLNDAFEIGRYYYLDAIPAE